MSDYKVISHVERMKNKALHKECPVTEVTEVATMVQEQEVQNGRVVKVLKSKLVDPKAKFEKFKVSDFCIENLQASGAIANLKNCTLEGSIDASISNAANVLESLENIKISENE